MPRQPRIEYDGALYHVMARGNRKEDIFRGDHDREMFLATLAEACQRTGWRVHAWTLMNNHYHWLLETPEANLVQGMKWFQNTYTRRFNTRHRASGHLFGGRYKAILVQGDGEGGRDYVTSLMDYIHLNAVRAGLVREGEGLGLMDFAWSSLAQGYGAMPPGRPAWMETARGFSLFGLSDDADGRREFVDRLQRRISEEKIATCGMSTREGQSLQSTLRRGWYWGTQGFRERMLGQLNAQALSNRNYQTSPIGKAHDQAAAERILQEGLRAEELAGEDLTKIKGSDARKVRIAREIHAHTSVSQQWTATQLCMGSPANVSQLLRRKSKDSAVPEGSSGEEFVKNC